MTGQCCLFCGGDASAPDHQDRCDGRQGRREARDPDLSGMVHANDPYTSTDAAVLIARRRSELHQHVLDAFAACGPMTDGELEALPQFRHYGPSTIRKRRSELYQARQLEVVGERRNDRHCKMLVWAVRTTAEDAE